MALHKYVFLYLDTCSVLWNDTVPPPWMLNRPQFAFHLLKDYFETDENKCTSDFHHMYYKHNFLRGSKCQGGLEYFNQMNQPTQEMARYNFYPFYDISKICGKNSMNKQGKMCFWTKTINHSFASNAFLRQNSLALTYLMISGVCCHIIII